VIEQIISLVGAAMILFAYGGQQMQKMRSTDLAYILLNLTGSVILAIIAVRVRQTGLTVMEGAWALISGAALIRFFQKK
jgi:drug/metabolite transporter (DMT)-like permease